MTEYNETALVLEGGGNRGVFTAGVLDYLMEQKVEFPYVVGVSAGACNAIDYVSGQVGRTRRCMIVENKEYRYIMKFSHLILTSILNRTLNVRWL